MYADSNAVAPALEAVEYHEENFAGIFHQPSKYRGTPTPELEAEWEALWDCEWIIPKK